MKVLSFIHWHGTPRHGGGACLRRRDRRGGRGGAVQPRQARLRGAVSAIEYCLAPGGHRDGRRRRIAFPSKPFRTGRDAKLADDRPLGAVAAAPRRLTRARSRLHHAALTAALRMGSRVAPGGWTRSSRTRFRARLDARAAAARAGSTTITRRMPRSRFSRPGQERAAIATVDGRGDPYSTVTWEGRGLALRRLRTEPWCNSLGFFYRDCTQYLGLGEFGEGKTMGLAPYGDADALPPALEGCSGRPPGAAGTATCERPSELSGFPARDDRRADRAPVRRDGSGRAGAARAVDRAGSRVGAIRCRSRGTLPRRRRRPQLCRERPAARRGRMRRLGLRRRGRRRVSIGAALLAARDLGDAPPEPLEHAYLGPEFGAPRSRLRWRASPRSGSTRSRDMSRRSPSGSPRARSSAGSRDGWSSARARSGTAASSPTRATIATRDRVNGLKGREPWRPLAPSVLAERSGEYFDLAGRVARSCCSRRRYGRGVRERIPAVVHVDGSARPQTVRRHAEPALPRPDRGIRAPHGGADAAQHLVQRRGRADRLQPGATPCTPFSPPASMRSCAASSSSSGRRPEPDV